MAKTKELSKDVRDKIVVGVIIRKWKKHKILCPPLILAPLVNMSKGGYKNKSAFFIRFIFHSKNTHNSHWSKTIESGEKI